MGSAATVVALGGVGCDENPPDRTAARLAERVTHDQAEQNKRLADATKSLTQGSQQLGSLVGPSEANIRQALRLIDAMAPAVVFLDEVEKAFSGVAGSGQTDSGVSARLFGSFLSWLNDHESDVFVVATANDITKLPPEFSRAERFDGVFFLDLPDAGQR